MRPARGRAAAAAAKALGFCNRRLRGGLGLEARHLRFEAVEAPLARLRRRRRLGARRLRRLKRRVGDAHLLLKVVELALRALGHSRVGGGARALLVGERRLQPLVRVVELGELRLRVALDPRDPLEQARRLLLLLVRLRRRARERRHVLLLLLAQQLLPQRRAGALGARRRHRAAPRREDGRERRAPPPVDQRVARRPLLELLQLLELQVLELRLLLQRLHARAQLGPLLAAEVEAARELVVRRRGVWRAEHGLLV